MLLSQGVFVRMRGIYPRGLDKTPVVNDVLYLEISNPLFDRKSKEVTVIVVESVNR